MPNTPETEPELTAEEQLRRLSVEHSRLNDRYMSLLTNQARDSRASEATFRAALWRSVLNGFDLYVTTQAAETFRQLCGRIDYLPLEGRAPNGSTLRKLVGDLKSHATLARAELRRVTDAEAERQHVLVDEIQRLRAYITEQGRQLHDAAPDAQPGGSGRYCACVGCELIRGMDAPTDTNTDTDADAASSAVESEG